MIDLDGKDVLVLGLGMTGQSSALFCAERGAHVVVVDESPGPELELGPGIEVRRGAPFPDASRFDWVIASPGVPKASWEAVDPKAIGDVELASRFLSVPIVAVTGTNGKSTTVRLIEAMLRAAGLRAAAAGNVGEPVLGLVGRPLDVAVIEVSSFQLESVRTLAPRVSVWLNVTPDHLDRHGDFETYADTKAELLARQSAGDVAVLNHADEAIRKRAQGTEARVLWMDRGPVSPGAWREGDEIVVEDEGTLRVRLPALPPGVHPDCVLAALLAVHALGCDLDRAARALLEFTALPHRGECVRERAGVRFLDDSKATNPGAAAAALRQQAGPVLWIAGGRDKGLDYAPLAAVAEGRVRRAFLIGEAASALSRALEGHVPWEDAGELDRAVEFAAEGAVPGDVVLLAPACASFDQFASFEERGERFRRAVQALPEPREPREPRQPTGMDR